MRIVIIKQLFNPEPTAKSLDFAKELVARGHDVEVLTGFPSYPIGKIYDGYKQRFYKREKMEGIDIIRVPIYPDHSASGLKRFFHYISYALSATFIGLFLIKKPDVAFVYQGAIPVAIPAIILKKIRKVPFLYDINDLWPETVAASGMLGSKRGLKIINKWCNMNYRNASFITVATPGFQKSLIEKGVPKEKLEIVSNWSRDKISTEELPAALKKQYFKKEKINILYAGNLGIVQSLQTILKTAKSLQEQGLTKIQFLFLGGGADEENLKQYAADELLKNVTFIPRVASEEVSKYLNAGDFLLVHLKKDKLFEITIPSKILAYLKSGKPILMGLRGDAADILNAANAGFTFEPDNSDDLEEKIKQMIALDAEKIAEMGTNGKVHYEENLSIISSVDKIERNLLKIARK
ncbi:glycosyltransferase family 4 protein [uncultured Kordia sp.]|uniref:glycosyltransferase family 4 protein n=1 Tax=uncultured Kordia sp. TaxID=507699 RepID=UPI0026057EC2|nr:glycosyltransferase family 4 protein [uncultured Kordia sp.]